MCASSFLPPEEVTEVTKPLTATLSFPLHFHSLGFSLPPKLSSPLGRTVLDGTLTNAKKRFKNQQGKKGRYLCLQENVSLLIRQRISLTEPLRAKDFLSFLQFGLKTTNGKLNNRIATCFSKMLKITHKILLQNMNRERLCYCLSGVTRGFRIRKQCSFLKLWQNLL